MAFPGGVNAGSIFAHIGLKSTLAKDTKVANSKLDSLGKRMKGLAIPAAVAATALLAVGTAAFKLADNAGRAADELLDLEQITGLSTTTLQEFKNVTAIAGVSFDQFTRGVTTFERKLPELMSGTGRTTEMMERLGVSVFDGTGNLRDMDAIMPDLLGALAGMENETERNAIAMQLFGRNAEAMLPIIALGAENMKAAREEAHDMGLVIGGESLQAANDFRIEVDKLKAQLSVMGMEVGIELIPAFEGFVEILQKMVPHIKTGIHWGRVLYETLILPWVHIPSAMKAFRRNFADQINWLIDKYNEAAETVSSLGIEVKKLERISLDKPKSELDELRQTAGAAFDDVVDNYNTAQAAMSEPLIPGWAGQTEYIKAELERTGARNISELQEVYKLGAPAVAPAQIAQVTGAAAPGAVTGGQSAVSILMSINTGIEESNRLSESIISAVQNIRITTAGIGGGFGGRGGTRPLTADPEEVRTQSKSKAWRDLAQIVPGRL